MHKYLSTIFQLIFVFQRYFSPIIMCTSSQNGVAECKIQHLVETACNLLGDSNTPVRFWGNVTLTACYLINCMPSIVLQNQLPHSVLFPKQDLYSLLLHVFGCACLVHDLTPGKDKLVATSLKCLSPQPLMVTRLPWLPPKPLPISCLYRYQLLSKTILFSFLL